MSYEATTFSCNHCLEQFDRWTYHSLHFRYGYFNGDTKHPYEWKSCRDCHTKCWIQKRRDFCSYRCSKLGDMNPAKQKDSKHGLTSTEYVSVHKKVRRVRGKAFGCMHCGTLEDRTYHWANISGKYWDPYDYINLCVPCHDKYDRGKNVDSENVER